MEREATVDEKTETASSRVDRLSLPREGYLSPAIHHGGDTEKGGGPRFPFD